MAEAAAGMVTVELDRYYNRTWLFIFYLMLIMNGKTYDAEDRPKQGRTEGDLNLSEKLTVCDDIRKIFI